MVAQETSRIAIAEAAADSPAVDPITAEIVRSALVAITGEMKTNLMRTAYNMIIYEALDFTVGLFDADGNTVSIGLGLPMFIRGLSDAIKGSLLTTARRRSALATSSSPTTATSWARTSTT